MWCHVELGATFLPQVQGKVIVDSGNHGIATVFRLIAA
jgi:hypothetical protein